MKIKTTCFIHFFQVKKHNPMQSHSNAWYDMMTNVTTRNNQHQIFLI